LGLLGQEVAGAMVMSDDFDQPLSDEFWLQNP
jgi:hypothetical protein